MGYCVTVKESTIVIEKDKMKDILETISNEFFKHFHVYDYFCIDDVDFNAFYEDDVVDDDKISLKELWYDYLYLNIKKFGDNYIICDKRYEKLDEEFELLNLIAPCLKDGSYMEFYSETGERFRYTIVGNKCVKQTPKIIWE